MPLVVSVRLVTSKPSEVQFQKSFIAQKEHDSKLFLELCLYHVNN